jgi:hypothetical protein
LPCIIHQDYFFGHSCSVPCQLPTESPGTDIYKEIEELLYKSQLFLLHLGGVSEDGGSPTLQYYFKVCIFVLTLNKSFMFVFQQQIQLVSLCVDCMKGQYSQCV